MSANDAKFWPKTVIGENGMLHEMLLWMTILSLFSSDVTETTVTET